ncbi:MAG: aminotransferase class V-fold PLP-dependent enzyme, partial [Calditrichaeota bacterium]
LPDNIALVSNTSAGLNILALGLEWKAGDRILLNDFEFPANVIPFTNLQRLGVSVDFVKHRNGIIDPDDLQKAIRPQTRLLSISFVEFLNGFRNDLAAISSICREHDIIFSVDAIQGLGALRMDMNQLGIDFLASGGHKWLMWPAGLGVVYISPRIFPRLYPAQAGWMGLETPFDFFNYTQPFADSAQRFEPGSMNTMAMITATATLDMMLNIGIDTIEEKILTNTEFLICSLQEAGFEIFGDVNIKHRSGIVTFFHSKAEELFNYLRDRRVFVSLRDRKIRISPHFYNNHDDLAELISLIKKYQSTMREPKIS